MSQENVDLPPPPPPMEGKRNMKVIALAIICIVLAASLIGVIAVYAIGGNNSDLKSQIAQKDATIASINQSLIELQAAAPNVTLYIMQITSLEQQLSTLNDTISTLNDTATSYYNIASMKESMILLSQQQATVSSNNSTVAYDDVVPYAGYIKVQTTSTSTITYVEALYSSFGANFDQNVTTGTSGTATFPVLPGAGTLEVKIGNPESTAITVTVTITYYY